MIRRLLLPIFAIALLFDPTAATAQSAQVQISVTQNDQMTGGTLKLQVENKVTGITPSTLGSATLDLIFDKSHLTYVTSANGALSFLDGYSVSVTDNVDSVRLSISGGGVSPGNGLGHDIPIVFDTDSNLRELTFTITAACIAAGTTDITFGRPTATVGYFENQSNNPDTGVIDGYVPDAFGDATGIICDPGLPVELGAFDGVVDGQDALLSWASISEVNTDGYAIEMKQDEAWSEIGFVEAAGPGSSYSFRATAVEPGLQAFRLRIVEKDGSFAYSDVVELTVEVPGDFIITDAYPNPFNPFATFSVAVKENQNVLVEIYNSLGQRMQTLHSGGMISNESYEFRIDGTEFSSGLYLIKVSGHNFSSARTVTLLK